MVSITSCYAAKTEDLAKQLQITVGSLILKTSHPQLDLKSSLAPVGLRSIGNFTFKAWLA